MVQALIAIATWLLKLFTDKGAEFFAKRALTITLLTITLPIVIKNLVVWFFSVMHNVSSSILDTSGVGSVVIELSGLAGYLASHLRIPEAISIILTAAAIRLTLKLIPFL